MLQQSTLFNCWILLNIQFPATSLGGNSYSDAAPVEAVAVAQPYKSLECFIYCNIALYYFNDAGLLGHAPPPPQPFWMNVSMTNRFSPGRYTLLPHDGDIASVLAAKSGNRAGVFGRGHPEVASNRTVNHVGQYWNSCSTAFRHSHTLWNSFSLGEKKNESST